MRNWQRAGFGLYVHWPFCQAKCPYCDFNSHVVAQVDQHRWANALVKEINRFALATPDPVLSTIFFGGGTPSLMAPETVAAVISAARQAWRTSNDLEITLEANPTSTDAARFAGYRDAGVNRVSIGVQALDDADLKALGRLHDTAEAMAAVEVARRTFDRISFDLIYARQHQTLENWTLELTRALETGVDHLSLYQLTIEPETAFGARHARGLLPGLPSDDLGADMFAATQEITAEAGLPAYEISNHGRPGTEASHNLLYWRSGDWVGVGPGAHGRFDCAEGRVATVGHRAPGAWIEAVDSLGSGDAERDIIPFEEQQSDALMMGLRLVEGLYADNPGFGLLTDKENEINNLVDAGFLEASPEALRATPRGRPLLNAILRELLD